MDVNQGAVGAREGRMATHVGIAQPGSLWIFTVLITKRAFQHEDLFPAPVVMGLEPRIGRPLHQGDMLGLERVQRHHLQAIDQAGVPLAVTGLEPYRPGVLRTELPQFDKNRGTVRSDPG